MKTKTLMYAITAAAALGLSPAVLADDGASTAPTTGDAAQSKSGAGPGSTGNTAPDASPASQSPAATTGAPEAPAPNTGDAGQSKSGLAPGSNANPVGSQAGQPGHN